MSVNAERPLIAGNWKMHGLALQLVEIDTIAASVASKRYGADVLLCLPATLVYRGAQVAAGRIAIGGEDCHFAQTGAFTGDVSADMLRDAGATSVIVGHSERRRAHHETDAIVAAKAQAAWRAGLTTVLCVGESQAQRNAGTALATIADQLAASLHGLMPKGAATVIAYEPLWAIGSGHVPTSAQIVEAHRHIRHCLDNRPDVKEKACRIIYGGSVTGETVAETLALPEVGGVLVGGASLNAHDFVAILDAATQVVSD